MSNLFLKWYSAPAGCYKKVLAQGCSNIGPIGCELEAMQLLE